MTYQFLWHQYYVSRTLDNESCAECEAYNCTPCVETYPCDDQPWQCPSCQNEPNLDCDIDHPGYALFGPIEVSGVSGHAQYGIDVPTCVVRSEWVEDAYSCGYDDKFQPRMNFQEVDQGTDCPGSEPICIFDSQRLLSLGGDGPCIPQFTCADGDCDCWGDYCRSACYGNSRCCDADNAGSNAESDPEFTRVTNPSLATFTNEFYVTRKRGSGACFEAVLYCPLEYNCPSTVFKDDNYSCCGLDQGAFSTFCSMGVQFSCWDSDGPPITIDHCNPQTSCDDYLELNFGTVSDGRDVLFCRIVASPGEWPVATYADSHFIGCGCRGCDTAEMYRRLGEEERCYTPAANVYRTGWSSVVYYKGTIDYESQVVRYTKIASHHQCAATNSCRAPSGAQAAYAWSGSWNVHSDAQNHGGTAILGPNSFDIPLECDALGWTYYNPPPNPSPPTICENQQPL